MNSKKITLWCLLLGVTYTSQAQNIDEGLLFSQYEQGATARFKAMGNAQTALGGDLSSISGNPAGLGFFNNSDIGITLDYFGDRNKATYFGSQTNANYDRVGLNQLGIVFNLPNMRARGSNLETGWLNFNVGIGYNKTNSFYSKLNYQGNNTESSVADMMGIEAYDANSIFGDFGLESGLVDFAGSGANTTYYPMTVPDNTQRVFNQTRGSQSETNISFGANYSNKLYLGASVGISTMDYRTNHVYQEDGYLIDAATLTDFRNQLGVGTAGSRFLDPTHPQYQNYNKYLNTDYQYDYENWTETRGTGVNVKLGVIYRPTDIIRIGVSATTPTWYNMSSDFSDFFEVRNYEANSTTPVGDPLTYPEDPYTYDYNFRSPYRLNGGIAAVLSKGLISADIEFIDYASMKITTDDNALDMQYADDISATYQGAVNLKVGAEYMITPQFMIRGGYNHSGNPYKNLDYSAQTISGGLGYRIGNYYIDATYQNWRQKYDTFPYSLPADYEVSTPIANVTNTRNNVFLTFGAKF
jgi:hypothetical protein